MRTVRVAVAALVLAGAPGPPAHGQGGWTTATPMAVPHQEIGVAALGETIYAVAGFDAAGPTAAVEAYDTREQRWTSVASLPAALHHVAVAAAGGKLYAIGGLATLGFTAVDTVFAYDAALDRWAPRAPLPAPRGAGGVAVVGGAIYVAGGFRAGASIVDFAVYDTVADMWAVLPAMPTARDHLGAAAIAGRVYAVGGRANGRLFGTVEVGDPETGVWRTGLAAMPTPRGGLMVAALGERLFAFGGEGNRQSPFGVFPETEAYDPARDRWTSLAPMPTPRHGTAATAVGGAIYVVGGASREGFGVSGANEVFTPPPVGSTLEAVRARRTTGRRIRVRARIPEARADPATIPLGVSVLAGDDTLVAATLPPGSLVPNRRRSRFRYRSTAAGPGARLRRLVVRPRADGAADVTVVATLARLPALPADVVLALDLDGETLTGTTRLQRTAPFAASRRSR